ncbi:MAG: cytochrome d ubiquinol oxidase subunit II [Alistipes sp.]
METLILLQHYWWFLISVLGALLVLLLFVQGGQGLLYTIGNSELERTMIVNSFGRKWEFTFTTLVTFGGAFFASFPLFYSTSFGGAFYVWMAILLVFVIQAVAYEFRRKAGNLFGEKTYNIFLIINGIAAPLLIGTAVGTLFTGANFTVDRLNIANLGGNTAISQWTTPWHGLEALADYRNVALGLAVVFLSRMVACHYLLNNIDDETIRSRSRRESLYAAAPFLLFFLTFLISLLFASGWTVEPATGIISAEPYKYLHNLLALPAVTGTLLVGVVLVLWGILKGWQASRKAIWFSGIGTVLTVLALLLCAGWNNTAYYPSLSDMQSSLTIYNSSSSEFTLVVMSIVSLLIPFVLGYIWYAWRAIDRQSITRKEVEQDDHLY